jgi:undecaprenyl-diphosphatase
MAVAMTEVLRRAEPMDVRIDGEPRRLWLLFVGNGRYHPDGFAPSWRERLDHDELDLRVIDADHPWARTRLVVALMSGRLGRCRVYEERRVSKVTITLAGAADEMALDGELVPAPDEVTLHPEPRRLVVYRPAK